MSAVAESGGPARAAPAGVAPDGVAPDGVAPDGVDPACVGPDCVAGAERVLGAPEEIGRVLLGPLVLAFVAWLRVRCRDIGARRLFFAARDAALFLEAFRLAATHARSHDDIPETVYLPISRRAAVAASLADDPDCDLLFSQGEFDSVADLLRVRVGFAPPLAEEDAGRLSLLRDRDRVLRALSPCRVELARRAGVARDRLRRFVQQLGMADAGPAGLVDVGYEGTIQLALQALLDRPLAGLYLIAHPPAARVATLGGTAEGAFGGIADTPFTTPVTGATVIIEPMLTASHGSIIGYREGGRGVEPVYAPVTEPPARRATVAAIQAAALEHCRAALWRHPARALDPTWQRAVVEDRFAALGRGALSIAPALAARLSFDNQFAGAGTIDGVAFLRRIGFWHVPGQAAVSSV
jgi:hypothetical protein